VNRTPLAGLQHVRHLGVAASVVLALLVTVGIGYQLVTPVQVVIGREPRFVGAAELVAAVVGALVPAIAAPTFDQRERLAVGRVRFANTLVSLLLTLSPVLVLVTWYAVVRAFAEQLVPVPAAFVGNFLLIGIIGLAGTLLAGRRLGPVLSFTACFAVVAVQQAWPDAWLSTALSTSTKWTTTWWLIGPALVLVLALDFRLGSCPRGIDD